MSELLLAGSMDKKKLRESTSLIEILSKLMRFSMKEGHGFIWQNQKTSDSDVRHVWAVRLTEVDIDSQVLTFTLDPFGVVPRGEIRRQTLQEIHPGKTLYFKGLEQDILFKLDKAQFSSQGEFHLKASIPSSVYFEEKRSHPRFYPSSETLVNCKKPVPGKEPLDLNLSLRSIAENGLGLKLSRQNAHLFQENQEIYINQIGDFEFPVPIKGTIPYLKEYYEKNKKIILMGLELERSIPDNWWNQLSVA